MKTTYLTQLLIFIFLRYCSLFAQIPPDTLEYSTPKKDIPLQSKKPEFKGRLEFNDFNSSSGNSTHTNEPFSPVTNLSPSKTDSLKTAEKINAKGNTYYIALSIKGECKKDSTKSVGSSSENIIIMNNNKWHNHVLQFKGVIFSDYVGIKDDQPNGLVQTNFYFSYTRPTKLKYKTVGRKDSIIIKKNGKLKAKDKFKIKDTAQIKPVQLFPFRNAVLLDITLSKTENSSSKLPVRYEINSSNQPTSYINKFDALQYANVLSVSKINLVTLKWYNVLSVYLDYTPMFYSTTVIDTLIKKEAFQVSTITHGGNLKIITKKDEKTKLSSECSFSVFCPQLISRNISNNAGYQLKEQIEGQTTLEPESSPNSIQAIEIRIIHNNDKNISTYFRFASYGNFIHRASVPMNNFVQLQLGVSFNIDKLFYSSENKKKA